MRLSEQLHDYINAAFTGLWVQTHEPDEAERELTQLAQERQWRIAVWDIAQGLRTPGQTGAPLGDAAVGDPLAALRALPAFADPHGTSILLVHNFHRLLGNPEVVQTVF